LALVAGAAALIGFWLARRRQPQAAFSSDTATVGPTTSAAGVALAFILRNAIQRLPFILQQIWAARQERAARGGSDMPIDA